MRSYDERPTFPTFPTKNMPFSKAGKVFCFALLACIPSLAQVKFSGGSTVSASAPHGLTATQFSNQIQTNAAGIPATLARLASPNCTTCVPPFRAADVGLAPREPLDSRRNKPAMTAGRANWGGK
jgi:hypothetical protein